MVFWFGAPLDDGPSPERNAGYDYRHDDGDDGIFGIGFYGQADTHQRGPAAQNGSGHPSLPSDGDNSDGDTDAHHDES